jgi:hypothetical protein
MVTNMSLALIQWAISSSVWHLHFDAIQATLHHNVVEHWDNYMIWATCGLCSSELMDSHLSSPFGAPTVSMNQLWLSCDLH